jgi:hypothetical protein
VVIPENVLKELEAIRSDFVVTVETMINEAFDDAVYAIEALDD